MASTACIWRGIQVPERCIDYGGHPNERALAQGLKTEKGVHAVNLKIVYLTTIHSYLASA